MTTLAYVRSDTAEDAVASFELAADFYALALKDDRYWKWFIVALHAGVQGTFVLALARGDGFLVQKPGVMTKMLAAHKTDADQPQPHMDNFLKLYKKLQQKENLRSSDALPLPSSPEHELAVVSLDTLRDEFLHFNAKSWSIERALIIERAVGCLEVASFILAQKQAIFWHEKAHVQRASAAITRLTVQLRQDS